MNELEFTHTTHGTPVTIYSDQIFAIMFLPTMKSVVLVGPGSTAVPVVGTLEEIKLKVSAAKRANPNP